MKKECVNCEGTGWVMLSCCGHDMRHADILICPERGCHEHCGDEHQDCEECNGTGYIYPPMTKEERTRTAVLIGIFIFALSLIIIALTFKKPHASQNTSPSSKTQPGLVRK